MKYYLLAVFAVTSAIVSNSHARLENSHYGLELVLRESITCSGVKEEDIAEIADRKTLRKIDANLLNDLSSLETSGPCYPVNSLCEAMTAAKVLQYLEQFNELVNNLCPSGISIKKLREYENKIDPKDYPVCRLPSGSYDRLCKISQIDGESMLVCKLDQYTLYKGTMDCPPGSLANPINYQAELIDIDCLTKAEESLSLAACSSQNSLLKKARRMGFELESILRHR